MHARLSGQWSSAVHSPLEQPDSGLPMYPGKQVQTGLSLSYLSYPGRHWACVPQGFGSHKSPETTETYHVGFFYESTLFYFFRTVCIARTGCRSCRADRNRPECVLAARSWLRRRRRLRRDFYMNWRSRPVCWADTRCEKCIRVDTTCRDFPDNPKTIL